MVRKRTRRFVARSVRFLAVPLVLAGVGAAAGIAPAGLAVASVASAASVAAQARIGAPRTFIPFGGQFNGAAVTSSGAAWAVGLDSGPLAQYWNGKAWKRVSSPNPGPEGTILTGVTATSATNAWAVGSTGAQKTVIEHWNGKSWTRVASPSPGTYDQLWAVTASSASNAKDAEELHTLILHWNGKVWAQVPSPDPVTVKSNELTWNLLQGVTAMSASNAWAVGTVNSGGLVVLLHWNGKHWVNFQSANALR
jgi:hypothetical protein